MSVKIFGHTVSKPAAIAIAGGSGLAIWFAYKQHKASAGSASSPTSIDPVTGLPYSQDNQIDPLTGQAYLAEAQQYGSVSAAEQAYASSASTSLSAAGGSYSGGGGGGYTSTGTVGSSTGTGTTVTDVPSTGYTSNAQWAAAVTAGLVTLGYSASEISGALGAYLGSLPETPGQVTIVDTALAEYGPPPVGSFTVIQASANPPTGSGSTGTGTSGTTPPPTTGPGRLAGITGISEPIKGPTGVRFTWNPVPGATGYVCLLKKGGENGTTVNGPFTVTAPVCNFGGLTARTAYTAFIWPSDAADRGGTGSNQPHAQISFTTT